MALEDAALSRVARLEGRRGQLGYGVATDGLFLYFLWAEDVGDIWVMDIVAE